MTPDVSYEGLYYINLYFAFSCARALVCAGSLHLILKYLMDQYVSMFLINRGVRIILCYLCFLEKMRFDVFLCYLSFLCL